MKIFITTLFSLILTIGFSQDFYDMNTIQSIKITFAQSNWDQILDNAYPSGEYTLAESVEINGIAYDSVGVKYKGNSTYQATQNKNPFHIELDTYKDHEHDGYTDIKLSNVAKDPSFLREVLSYQILRQYMVASQSNYANVYVNDQHIGLYSNSEAVSKKFVNRYFGNKKNTFIKCNPPAGAGPQSNDLPSLEYLGQDSTDYYESYEMKSDYGWGSLIDFIDTLNNHIEDIESILDVDKTLWMHAYNNALVNLDSYSGTFTQNYYLYRNNHGQFMPVVWDLNESFGKFSATGNGNLNGTNAKSRMDHLLHENDADYPLIQKLLSIPLYKRMYLAHYKTIMLENFDNESYYNTATELMALINQAVQDDDNNLFTYNDFLENLDSDIGGGGPGGPGGGGGGATPGIAPLMDARNDYILGLPDFTQVEPTISNIEYSSNDINVGNTIFVTATVSNADDVYLGFRNEDHAPFTKIPMLDDGLNGDGAAGDGVYGLSLNIISTFTQYYIYADNSNIGKFSPVRAEHEFHTLIANNANAIAGDIVINEFQASNDMTVADQDGEFDDWIELYNNSNEEVALDAYSLTDDHQDLNQWSFPEGTSIAANDYLIVWCDKDETQDGLHANFKLSAAAETIILSDNNVVVIDEVNYLNQTTDQSYGRFPNGTGEFTELSPTFNSENLLTNVEDLLDNQLQIDIFPNPSNNIINIVLDQSGLKNISVYNVNGKKIHQATMVQHKQMDVSNWTPGIYMIQIDSQFLKLIVE